MLSFRHRSHSCGSVEFELQLWSITDRVAKCYKLANATLFLGVISAVLGLVAGAIVFGIGSIFGSQAQ
ncbi:hypothetical protein CA850_28765 [Micromonospora echinospora]|nr:hypothetical protein CA850_28765 [Micromonospora echinospora]